MPAVSVPSNDTPLSFPAQVSLASTAVATGTFDVDDVQTTLFRSGPVGTVLDHAQYTAWLERCGKAAEHQLRPATLGPVMHVAERQHHVCRTRRGEYRRLRIKVDEFHLVVNIGL